MRERLDIRPATLRLLARQDRIVDRPLRVIAPAKVMGQELDDLVGAMLVEHLERSGGSSVQRRPTLLKQGRVRDLLDQHMLEDVDPLAGPGSLVEELPASQLS